MAFNQQNPFWDFVRSMNQGNDHADNTNGEGVDRPANIPGAWPYAYGNSFGGWPYPPPPPPPGHEGAAPPPPPPSHGPGHHGPHHGHHPPPFGRQPDFGAGFPFGGGLFGAHHGPHHGPHRGLGCPPRGGPHGRGRRGRHGRRGERGGHETENEDEGQQGPWGAFDMSGLLAALASHPLAQPYRQFFENLASQAQRQESGETARDGGVEDEENTFTPPVDIFTTETEYVLHIALPGAKKEDVGINWDAEKNVLNVAGVIYRQGDEEFLRQLTQSERKVGVFERAVKLPPAGEEAEKEEVDGDGITAKLEDGVLVVRVPKVEREWTDVKKVDIQ